MGVTSAASAGESPSVSNGVRHSCASIPRNGSQRAALILMWLLSAVVWSAVPGDAVAQAGVPPGVAAAAAAKKAAAKAAMLQQAAQQLNSPQAAAASPQSRSVPGIVGMTCSDARALKAVKVYELNLQCQVGDPKGFTPGLINQQYPIEGATIPDSRIVVGYVEPEAQSGGMPNASNKPKVPRVQVPDVGGANGIEARQLIEAKGLVAVFKGGPVDADHKVTDQRPKLRTWVPSGSTVLVVLAAQYRVPDLTGFSCGAANKVARENRFPGVTCTDVLTYAQERFGTVFKQNPTPQAVLAQPTVIGVWVYKAPPQVIVPSVEQHTVREARVLVSAARLRVQVGRASSAPLAVVSAQAPAAGISVPEQSVVQLTTVIPVPDVRGYTCSAAKALAAEYGLTDSRCVPQEPPVESATMGKIFAQSPGAGAQLSAPSVLTLQQAAYAIPDVENRGLLEAMEILKKRHFIPVPDVKGSMEHRQVESQRPKAGGVYLTSISVHLNSFAFVTVPRVTGMSCDNATTTLNFAGLTGTCQLDTQWWSVGTPTVYLQTIAPGKELRENSQVMVQARAVDAGKIGAGVLAVLAATVATMFILRPHLRWHARVDPEPLISIREANLTDADWAVGLVIRGEADEVGSPILREGSEGRE